MANFLGPQGWLPDAQDVFTIGHQPVPIGVKVIAAGQRFERDRVRRITRALQKGLRRGNGPAIAARLTVAEVRDVSARNPSVGMNLLVSSLPRVAVPASVTISFTQPEFGDKATFVYVPADRDEPVLYGPNTACGGLAMAGLMVSDQPLPPPRLFQPPTG